MKNKICSWEIQVQHSEKNTSFYLCILLIVRIIISYKSLKIHSYEQTAEFYAFVETSKLQQRI